MSLSTSLLSFLPSHSEKALLNPALMLIPILTEIITLSILPSLYIHNSHTQRILLLSVSFPIIISTCAYIVLFTTSPEQWLCFGVASAAVFVVFQSFDLLLFSWIDHTDPKKVFYRTDVQKGGWLRCRDIYYPTSSGSKREKIYLRRIAWAADLVFCMRGVGWNIESKKTILERERMQNITRGRFIKQQLHTIAGIWLLLDVLKTYMVLDTWFSNNTAPFSTNYVPTIPGKPWIWGVGLMFFRNALGTLAVYAAVEGESAAIALFLVSSGLSSPSEFPRSFGRLYDRKCWSLPGFWGNAWHQSFRRAFTAPVMNSRGILRLIIPFMMSSLLHWAGSYTAGGFGRRTIVFFWVQPVGVILQNVIVSGLDSLLYNPHERGKTEEVVKQHNGYAGTNGNDGHTPNGATVAVGDNSRPTSGVVRVVRPSFETSGSQFVDYITLLTSLLWLLSVSTRYFEEYVKGGMFAMEPVPISFCRMVGMVDGEWVRWKAMKKGV